MHSIGWRAFLFPALLASACAPIAPSPSKFGPASPSSPISPGGEPSGSQSPLQTTLEFIDESLSEVPNGSYLFSPTELSSWVAQSGVQIETTSIPPSRIVFIFSTRNGLGGPLNFRAESISLGGGLWWVGINEELSSTPWEELAPRLRSARLEW